MEFRRNLTNCLGALFTSPNENELIHKIFRHEHWKNLQHILKFHTRPNCNVKLFKCLHKKILHSNFNFHFGLVNNSSKHSSIPLYNSHRWEITQHIIDTKNQQFFWSKRWWTYTQVYLWSLLHAPQAHLTKTTTKFVNKKTHSWNDNAISKITKINSCAKKIN